ncbi:nucleotidyltransferase family protein [Coraliomargarita parva]|uniref:nucleotidyltransferase family protein n=1 Tax=Coraliomargarita parva TaxID=3014050 RepID=UPI0022B3C9A5|nr:nucleotidyltransferase domain-containing protein [Coraliomargarita parva]
MQANPTSDAPHPAVELAKARISQHIREHLSGAQVWLFGSRARGDASRRSDFDLAYKPAKSLAPDAVSRFEDALRNDPEIIYPVDLVNLDQAPEPLRKHIEAEGILWKN